ncbi:MAG TPA: threonine/serine exporter family protein, partial [Desulfitobacteriaceae bacterium]|nr:threonine/serine exporter family protein [Desulfitobacteriaceae bacterium]
MIYAQQIITAFLGSLGFSMLFNIRGRKIWYAATGGMLSWATYL